MPELGYHLSSEEHGPGALVDHAVAAEAAGFDFVGISDHWSPWLDRQGHSPFVWSVLGAIAHRTSELRLGTAVTCPILRQHPALVAHAAATVAVLAGGERFFLGVGTGERLNEHVLGQHWPPASVRLEMLEEAVEVLRRLWSGDLVTHTGHHYTVENARLHDRSDTPPPVLVGVSGDESVDVARRIGDGIVTLSPAAELVDGFRAGGAGGPAIGMTHVCWAPSKAEGLAVIRHWWANTGVPGALNAELPLPRFFEAASDVVPDDVLAGSVVHGPDVDEIAENLRAYVDAGYDHVLVHQIGPDQAGFIEVAERELLPRLR